MVGAEVCISSDINGDVRMGSLDVINYEGECSQGNNPLMILPSGRQVDPYVGRWGLPRDVKKEGKSRRGSSRKHHGASLGLESFQREVRRVGVPPH